MKLQWVKKRKRILLLMDKTIKMKLSKLIVVLCLMFLISYAKADTITSVQIGKQFEAIENQLFQIEEENLSFKIMKITTPEQLTNAQKKRPYPDLKIQFEVYKNGARLDSYIWYWAGRSNKNNSPVAWNEYIISLIPKEKPMIQISKAVFEKPFFLKTEEKAIISNLEIRYQQFSYGYDPAEEGKGYMKKMQFYLKHGKNSKDLEITIYDKPFEIEWMAYKIRFIKDVQEFVEIEVIRNE